MRRLFIFFAVILFSISLVAAFPNKLHVTGVLENSTGSLVNGTNDINFTIYNSSSTALWSKNISVAADTNGIYSVELTDVNLEFDNDYTLGIKVGTDAEMTPRINLTATPYAFTANVTNNFNPNNNLTLADKISFRLGEIIDNIVNGFISITGGLKVSDDLIVNNSVLFVNAANGRVGIGTASPGAKLEVNGSILPSSTNTSTLGNATQRWNALYVGPNEAVGANRVTISDGNIFFNSGIGGSSWSSNIGISGYETTWGGASNFIIGPQAGSNYDLILRADNGGGDISMTVAGGGVVSIMGGNVGIGTTTPTHTLNVVGDANVTGTVLGNLNATTICIGTDCKAAWPSGGGSGGGWTNDSTSSSTDLNVNLTSGNLTIANGRVGIGTATPSERLQVSNGIGNLYVKFPYNLPSLVSDRDIYLQATSGSTAYMGDVDVVPLRVNNVGVQVFGVNFFVTNGNVGIGTTAPTQKLEVVGNVNVSGTVYATNFSSNSPLQLQTGGTTRIYVDNTTGNVGIGTTNPIHTLDVVGDMNITGNLSLGGAITGQEQSRARARSTDEQLDLTSSTPTKVVFQVEDFDEQGEFDLVNSKFVAAETGYYQANANVVWKGPSVVAGKRYDIVFYVNGAAQGGGGSISQAAAVDYLSSVISEVVYLTAGQRIEVYATQWSGVNTVDIYGALFSIQKLESSITIGSESQWTRTNGDIYYQNLTGKVGIGTTAPTHKLNVVGDANITGTVLGNLNATTICIGTDCKAAWPSGGGSGGGWTNDSTTTSTDLNVNLTSGNLTIANGNIGIGTTSSGTYPGELYFANSNAIRWRNSANNAYINAMYVDNANTLQLGSGTNDTSISTTGWGVAMTLKGLTGNVGIGTTTPTQKLEVVGNVNVSGTVYANNFSSNSPLQLQTGGTTRIYVNDSNGNVGIGTTSPTSALDVKGTFYVGPSSSSSFSASGGTITYSGGYTIHTFTSSGTFTPTGNGSVEVLVVAGGGGGGKWNAGGGGAGGLIYNSSYIITGSKNVTIGAGGASTTNGDNSVFGELTAIGGGAGGWERQGAGGNGGSGGGGGLNTTFGTGIVGQGNNGSLGEDDTPHAGGGGGGAGAKGTKVHLYAGVGGDGLEFSQFASVGGSPAGWFAGGGGGGGNNNPDNWGVGGKGGGGNGTGGEDVSPGTPGIPNTGGGGGAGGHSNVDRGEIGGSGIVIVRYPTSVSGDFLTVDASGNVGIGTTTPTQKLNVVGDANITGDLYAQGNSNFRNIAIGTSIITGNTSTCPSGLVAYWSADDTQNDSLGINNGTISGSVPYVTGKIGKAFNFSAGGFITYPNANFKTATAPSYTIQMWVYQAGPAGNYPRMFMNGDVNTGITITQYGTTNKLLYDHDGGGHATPTVLQPGNWVHMVFTYNGTTKLVYANSTLIDTEVDILHDPEGSVGYIGGETGLVFKGYLDEVAFWNRALSTSEISDLYNNGSGKSYCTTIYYPNNISIIGNINQPYGNFTTMGLLGIGTTNPTQKLEVVGTANITESLYVNGTRIAGTGVPAGAIMSFNLATCPTGWILADGTSGTPDLRGIFVRGSGTSGVLKYANGSYLSATYGAYMNDTFQGHWHAAVGQGSAVLATGTYLAISTYDITGVVNYNSNDRVRSPVTDGTDGAPRNGSETSPAYYSAIYCVKTAEDTPVSNSIWGTSGDYIVLNNQSKSLNVNNTLVVNSSSGKVGIGTTSPDVALDVNGYTQLGSDAPKIKMKKLTGTTASAEGGTTNIAHGLDISKIISLTAGVQIGTTHFIPPSTLTQAEVQYDVIIYQTNAQVMLHATNSGSILSKPVIITIIYEE